MEIDKFVPNITGIVTATVGVLMLIAGVFGLLDVKRAKIRTFGAVIFVISVVSIVLTLPELNFIAIISAILAWLYILAVN